MKNLLILISFLLLSSPLFGDNHKGETLYRYENPSVDGYVWKWFGDKNNNPKYVDEVKNGKPNGIGVLIYSFGEKYEGNWGWFKNPNDGRKYIGEHKVGKRDGRGTITTLDGTKYVGGWKNSKRNGQVIYTSEGFKYIGKYKDDSLWKGTSYNKDGNIIEKYVNGNRLY